MGQQLFALTFVQAENWVDVGAAVAIFGEKAGNRFRRMVGTDHNSFGHSGDAVLGLHSLTGFFISANARQGTLLWCDFCKQELILVNEKIVLIYG